MKNLFGFVIGRLQVNFFVAWYDGWLGFYFDRKNKVLYIGAFIIYARMRRIPNYLYYMEEFGGHEGERL